MSLAVVKLPAEPVSSGERECLIDRRPVIQVELDRLARIDQARQDAEQELSQLDREADELGRSEPAYFDSIAFDR